MPLPESTARTGPSIRPSDFQHGREYKGITEKSTGELTFWPSSDRTPGELEAVSLLWHTHPALRPKLDDWVVDGAYCDLGCGSCGKVARVWTLDCRCRLLSVEYAERWLLEKFDTQSIWYEMLVGVCREKLSEVRPAESLSGGAEKQTDKSSAGQTKRRSPNWLTHRRELGPPTCVLLESGWSSWKTTRHVFEQLEYRYGLGGQKSDGWGLVQLLHPALPCVRSLYVGPKLPAGEWERLETETVEAGEFATLFHRMRVDWGTALHGMDDVERGFREAELKSVPLLTRRGIFYQVGLFPKDRAATRDRREDGLGGGGLGKSRLKAPGSGDLCPSCGIGHLHSGGLHRELSNWSKPVEASDAACFED